MSQTEPTEYTSWRVRTLKEKKAALPGRLGNWWIPICIFERISELPPQKTKPVLEKGMATHSNILVWRISWTWSLAGYSPCGCKQSDSTERLELSLFKIKPAIKGKMKGFPGGPWLRLHLPMQGVWVLDMVGELRPHMPFGQKRNQKTEAVV